MQYLSSEGTKEQLKLHLQPSGHYITGYEHLHGTDDSPASTMFYSPVKFRHGPSRPESVRPDIIATARQRHNNLSMLGPGVTDSCSSLSSLGLILANTARRGQCHYETSHVALVKSVFTEAVSYTHLRAHET